MVVKTKSDKNYIKISSLSEGKGIERDAIEVLKVAEMVIKEALDSGYKIFLKKVPAKMRITFKALQKIDEMFEIFLVCDGYHFLSTRFFFYCDSKTKHRKENN